MNDSRTCDRTPSRSSALSFTIEQKFIPPSKPSLLKQATEPIGEDNDRYILESVSKSDAFGTAIANRIILAWGNHGAWQQQDLYTLELLKNHNHLYSLGMTKRGCPRHPLYLHRNSQPQIYDVTCYCLLQ